MRRPKGAHLLVLCCSLLLLQGCALSDSDDLGGDPAVKAQELVTKAMADFKVGQYRTALEDFEKVMDNYPFEQQAIIAELKAADCHYYLEEYIEAKVLYQKFEERHPTNEATPYTMFQAGMCDIQQTDRIDRNVSGAKDAIKSFSRLLAAFPKSPYTREAEARMKAAKEFLTNHEFFVAVFYVRSERYNEAKYRLKYIVNAYPDSAICSKAKDLLARLEAGEPPRIGINKWLPDFEMPDWRLFSKKDS
ncbi:MAG: outer membrane protein assembly factor BamD [Desulfobulbaceae bacterium]|nr:outer membrane protein assembly factor BamD [Desulfobulbaceae bacterium]